MAGQHTRRDRGEGALFQDGTGRWIGRVVVDGKRIKVSRKTKTEALQALKKLRTAADEGEPITPGDLTVADLLEQWKTKHLPNRNLEPATVARHGWSVAILTRMIGSKRVRTLTPDAIESALQTMADNGAARASLAKLKTTLTMALAWAERRGIVARNVASVVELPSNAKPSKIGRSLTVDQARALLDASAGTPLDAMWTVMLYLGLRPGEAAGLSWEDVDFDNGIVHVRRARKTDVSGAAMIGVTKTPWSVRSLDAPPPVLESLRAHRKRQATAQLAMGALWRNDEDLVFTSATGRPSDPARVRREFDAVAKAAELDESWSPNMLRHTAASLMADAGAPIEEVADQLGHRDTRMASLHYRHRIRPTVSGGRILGDVLGAG